MQRYCADLVYFQSKPPFSDDKEEGGFLRVNGKKQNFILNKGYFDILSLKNTVVECIIMMYIFDCKGLF